MPGTKKLSPWTSALPVGAPSVVPAGRFVAPPREPAAGGPAGGVMLRNAAFMSALTWARVPPGSNSELITVPLIVGGEPPQRPKPPAPSSATALHVAPGSRITLPLMCVRGAVGVLVVPVVAAIPKAAAAPRLGPAPAGPGPPPAPAPPPKIFPHAPPPPHPATNAAKKAAANQVCALEPLPCFFIFLPFFR